MITEFIQTLGRYPRGCATRGAVRIWLWTVVPCFRPRLSRASSVSLIITRPLRTMMQNDKDQEVMIPLTSEKDTSSPLPVPVSTQPQKPKLTAVIIIPVWIVLSSTVIIYNNYIYNTLYFKYPVFLVTWHLTFAVRSFSLCDSITPISSAGSSARSHDERILR